MTLVLPENTEAFNEKFNEFLTIAVDKGVNSFFVNDFLSECTNETTNFDAFDKGQYYISSKLINLQHSEHFNSEMPNVDWFDVIQLHIFLFFKGIGSYKKDNILSLTVISTVISKISFEIGSHMGSDPTLISLAVGIIFFSICKVSINSWCTWYETNKLPKNELLKTKMLEMKNSK